jgi:hypothetical protein
MNYLAHGYRYLDSPYFLAGTAVPDWLSVVDRKVRVRSRTAAEWVDSDDPITRQIAGGIIQHLADDQWFHQTRAFAETSLRFAVELRQRLPGDEGFRPSFLGHILVEVLIDATLIQRDRTLADRYYAALARVSGQKVQQVVNAIAKAPTDRLEGWISRFLQVQFIYDYLDDSRLLYRMEQVMARVGLPPLGDHLVQWLPSARQTIADRCDELLTPSS